MVLTAAGTQNVYVLAVSLGLHLFSLGLFLVPAWIRLRTVAQPDAAAWGPWWLGLVFHVGRGLPSLLPVKGASFSDAFTAAVVRLHGTVAVRLHEPPAAVLQCCHHGLAPIFGLMLWFVCLCQR